MFDVMSGNTEAQMQSCRPNYQIFKCNYVAHSRLLTLNAPGKLRNFERDRMHNHVLKNTIRENPPPLSICFVSGAINAVRQLNNADSRNRYINFAVSSPRPVKKVFNALSEPLARNQNAGIEN